MKSFALTVQCTGPLEHTTPTWRYFNLWPVCRAAEFNAEDLKEGGRLIGGHQLSHFNDQSKRFRAVNYFNDWIFELNQLHCPQIIRRPSISFHFVNFRLKLSRPDGMNESRWLWFETHWISWIKSMIEAKLLTIWWFVKMYRINRPMSPVIWVRRFFPGSQSDGWNETE